jgi:PTS system D-glucosamine-specific IIC component
MHFLNVGVGMTFSGGLIDLFLFGILQGNNKTNWVWIVIVGIFYFIIYYLLFSILIKKLNLRTPGRFEDDEVKLYERNDYNAKKTAKDISQIDEVSANICDGLGGKDNISDVDCCATRLRVTVYDSTLVNDSSLRLTGASGVIHKGNGVQIIYGPKVTVIKSNLDEYIRQKDKFASPNNGQSAESIDKKMSMKENNKKPKESLIVYSPVTGEADNIEKVPDEAFAGKMMGDGAMVVPMEPIVMSPVDGVIEFIFDTKHAIGIRTDCGVDIIIHIGIDTVRLKGEGFDVYVKQGQKVKKGDNLMKLNLRYLKNNAPSMASPILCTNMDNKKIVVLNEGKIYAGEELFRIDMY